MKNRRQKRIQDERHDRIKSVFKLMEYSVLTDRQLDLIISFEEQFNRKGDLSDRQLEILEDIFKRAAEKA